jgi:predicted RNase H-like nuclease (RuvC/YqgF family)
MDSDDEEERLRRWKEHLAAQQTDDEEEGPPPAALLSARRGESAAGSRATSARRRAEPTLGGGVHESSEGAGEKIDWMSAMMPQLRQLQQDKESLQTRINEQERMISNLKLQNQELQMNASLEDRDHSDQKENKIVELAKKNRALILALDKERAKCGRVQAELKRVQQELDAANRGREAFAGMDARSLPKEAKGTKDGKPGGTLAFGRAIAPAGDTTTESEQTPEGKIKELSNKVATLTGQMNSQRLANERLKQENGKVKEALKRELGDVALDTALRGVDGTGGGWTGRAQTISLLQSKIVELKRELASSLEAKLAPSGSPNGIKSAGAGGGTAVSSPGKTLQLDAASRVDAQHRREIEKIERDRRQEASALSEEMERERAEKKELKRKLDAATARVSVLDKETRDLRDKIEVANPQPKP